MGWRQRRCRERVWNASEHGSLPPSPNFLHLWRVQTSFTSSEWGVDDQMCCCNLLPLRLKLSSLKVVASAEAQVLLSKQPARSAAAVETHVLRSQLALKCCCCMNTESAAEAEAQVWVLLIKLKLKSCCCVRVGVYRCCH